VFGWGNIWEVGTKSSRNPPKDFRRKFPHLEEPGILLKGAPPNSIAKLQQVNPDIWPSTFKWKKTTVSISGSSDADVPEMNAAKRDLFYYDQYVRAIAAQSPGYITRVVPQLSNCSLGLLKNNAWLNAMAVGLPAANKRYGFPPDIQIEGCNIALNAARGASPMDSVADCDSYNAILVSGDSIISMWNGDQLMTIGKDFQRCP
jgi:hypothetical protein